MKKKTFLRFLPVLLVAPILACCVTVFATADEIEGQTFYDKVISPIENTINKILWSDENSSNLTSEPQTTQFESPLFGATKDDSGLFRVNLVTEGTETVAKINSPTDDLKDNTEIEELVIPNRVTISGVSYNVVEIESSAFVGESFSSTKLKKITINGWEEHDGKIQGGWFRKIGTTAFQHYCDGYSPTNLTTITLPDCMTEIGVQVFNQDEKLTTVNVQKYNASTGTITEEEGLPSGLTELPENLFVECRALNFSDNFVIPQNIKYIGKMCFDKCSSLTSINIGDGVVTIDDNGFSDCTALTKITMGKALTTINTHGFTGNTALRELLLGEKLSSIGEEAFSNCTALETIDFVSAPELTNTGVGTFMNCTSLTHLEFTDSNITKIGARSFLNCYNLNNIKFNNIVAELDEYCFSNWTETAASTTASMLEYVYLPESAMKIQKGAFQNSENLKEVIIGMKTGKAVGAAEDMLADDAFANCPNLVSATFLWDLPWQIYKASFIGTGTHEICADTGSKIQLQVRFRPLAPDMAWLEGYSMKSLDDLFPVGSLLCISAVFCDNYYGNDLENYLEQNGRTQEEVEETGAYDNETFATRNKSLNNVQYKEGISVPDTVTIDDKCTTDKIMKSKTKGANSKTIDFIYDDTQITQTTYSSGEPKVITREADDGILNIGNTAIQINVGSKGETTTLNVTRTNKNGTKTNPCIYGHGSTKVNNPFESTYKYLTAEADQTSYNNDEEAGIREPKLNEHEESGENPGLFSAITNDFDMEVNDACCIFCRSNAILNISDIIFGGDLYNPITETTTTTENICQLGCVYNSGAMTMTNCTFTNTTSTWSKEKGSDGKPVSYGGSCVFNFGKNGDKYNTMTGCKMENCRAALDGGAVLNADKLQITDCTFIDCSAARNGGAVFTNLGDKEKGGIGKHGNLLINGADKGCSFTNCQAKNGGAIQYRNVLDGELMLTLQGKLSFSGNKDSKGNIDDLCMGPDFTEDPKKQAGTSPFVLNSITLDGTDKKITVSAIKPKTGLVLCNNTTPSSVGLFKYQNNNYSIATNDDGNIVLGGEFPKYSLTAENGVWKDESGNTVETFMTSLEQTTPEAAQTITYTDPDGVSHTLTAVADSDDYDFVECVYDSNTQTYTAKFAIPEKQNNNPLLDKIKDSINNRNADTKENAKLEIYGK